MDSTRDSCNSATSLRINLFTYSDVSNVKSLATNCYLLDLINCFSCNIFNRKLKFFTKRRIWTLIIRGMVIGKRIRVISFMHDHNTANLTRCSQLIDDGSTANIDTFNSTFTHFASACKLPFIFCMNKCKTNLLNILDVTITTYGPWGPTSISHERLLLSLT